MRKHIEHLEIILKISERCNINCTYCYVFNKGNSAADESPALMARSNIIDLVNFLNNGHKDFDIDSLQIDFHGGEPLMLKKARFDEMCAALSTTRRLGKKLSLALQTNGILVDDEWIELFQKHGVSVSVSIDGTREINDLYRLDKRGNSTYEGTVQGLRLLQQAYRDGRISSPPGLLSVINSKADGAAVYRHFIDALEVRGFDFLLPDDTYNDTIDNNDGLGRFLTNALDEWVKDDDPSIHVRLFNTHLAKMLGAKNAGTLGHDPSVSGVYAFTIGSDGYARVDDTLRSTSDPVFDKIGHIKDISLADVLNSSAYRTYEGLGNDLPSECQACVWKNVCRGGRLINRYSNQDGFQRKTVYCNATRKFLSRMASHLLNMGLPEEKLAASLDI